MLKMVNSFDKDAGTALPTIYLNGLTATVMVLPWNDKVKLFYIVLYKIKEERIRCIKSLRLCLIQNKTRDSTIHATEHA